LGLGSLNVLEVSMVGGLAVFIMGLHIKAAIVSYRASARLWALLEPESDEEPAAE